MNEWHKSWHVFLTFCFSRSFPVTPTSFCCWLDEEIPKIDSWMSSLQVFFCLKCNLWQTKSNYGVVINNTVDSSEVIFESTTAWWRLWRWSLENAERDDDHQHHWIVIALHARSSHSDMSIPVKLFICFVFSASSIPKEDTFHHSLLLIVVSVIE